MILTSAATEPQAYKATRAGNGLAAWRLLRRGKNHLPPHKGCNADKNQQQHAKMHPTGGVHRALLPRLERQILSIERT